MLSFFSYFYGAVWGTESCYCKIVYMLHKALLIWRPDSVWFFVIPFSDISLFLCFSFYNHWYSVNLKKIPYMGVLGKKRVFFFFFSKNKDVGGSLAPFQKPITIWCDLSRLGDSQQQSCSKISTVSVGGHLYSSSAPSL